MQALTAYGDPPCGLPAYLRASSYARARYRYALAYGALVDRTLTFCMFGHDRPASTGMFSTRASSIADGLSAAGAPLRGAAVREQRPRLALTGKGGRAGMARGGG